MPLIGLLLGGINITDKTITLGQAVIKWGMFLQSILTSQLLAFSIFLAVKLLNSLQKKQAAAPAKQRQKNYY